jgi:hypothetical protein
MWEPSGGFFYTGTNDGVTVNKSPIPEDTQTWTHLALDGVTSGADSGSYPRSYSRSLDWAAAELAVLDHAGRRNSTVPAGQSYEGVTFSSASLVANEDVPIAEFQPKPDRNGVWFEGTAHLALALRDRGGARDEARARRLVDSIERAQDLLGAGQTVGDQGASRALRCRLGQQPARHRIRLRLLPVPACGGDRLVPVGGYAHQSVAGLTAAPVRRLPRPYVSLRGRSGPPPPAMRA